jgi:hypothetical protein
VDLHEFQRDVMKEINILAVLVPTLQVSQNEIQLKDLNKNLFSTNGDSGKDQTQQELLLRINELDKVITRRREELGLHTRPDDGV